MENRPETRPDTRLDQDKQRIKLLQIVCGVLAASTLLHLFLGQQAVTRNQVIEGIPGSFQNSLTPVFGMVSLVIVIMAVFLPDFLIKSIRQRKGGGALALQDIFPANIIRFALFEAVSIFGFLIANSSRDMNYSYVATGVALAGFIAFFPTEDRVRGQVKARI